MVFPLNNISLKFLPNSKSSPYSSGINPSNVIIIAATGGPPVLYSNYFGGYAFKISQARLLTLTLALLVRGHFFSVVVANERRWTRLHPIYLLHYHILLKSLSLELLWKHPRIQLVSVPLLVSQQRKNQFQEPHVQVLPKK